MGVTTRPITRKITVEELLGIVEQGGPLIEGTQLRCPGCENVTDVLDYNALEINERYAAQVVPPLKCKVCRHVFALKP